MKSKKLVLILPFIIFSTLLCWSENTVRDFCGINGVSLFHLEKDTQRWEIAGERLKVADWLGVKWHRCDFWWASIESRKNQFDFSFADKVVETFLANNRQLMPILCYNSAWQPNHSPTTDEEQALFARYVNQVVNRYKDKIKVWEVWNEPNIIPFWVPKPSPQHYARLLKQSYLAAKQADKDCKIIGFCTADPDYPFIEKVYELGGGKACDALSFHTYNAEKEESVLEQEIYNVKAIMNRYGDIQKKIWVTEIGLATGKEGGGIKPVSEGEQATWLIKKLITAMNTRVVERMFWFTINDWTRDPEAEGHLGVFDVDLVPKPAAFAYRTFLRLLGEREYLGSLKLSPTARCFLFHDRKKDIWAVLWTSKPREKVELVTAENTVSVYSLYGETEKRKTQNRKLELELTPIPLYVEGVDSRYSILACIKSVVAPIVAIPGQQQEIILDLNNPFIFKEDVELLGELSEGKFELKERTKSTPEKEKQQLVAILNTDKQAKAGWKELKLRIKPRNEKLKMLNQCYATIPIKVIEPVETEIIFAPEDARIKLLGKVKNVSTENLNGKALWRIEPAAKEHSEVRRPPAEIKDFSPNAINQYEAQLHPAFGERTIHFITQFIVSGEREYGAKKRLAVMPFVNKAEFVIDGSLVEWEKILPVALNSPDQLIVKRGKRKWQTEDLSGTIKLCFDKENLFIALDIIDDTPMLNPYEGSNLWRGDGAEVYLGFAGPRTEHWYEEHDFQIGISPGYNNIEPHCWLWQVGKTDKKLNEATIAVQKSEKGYTMEVQIPLSVFGVVDKIKPNLLLGFDVALNDLNEPTAQEKDFVLMWNGTEMNWRDPANWGVLQMQQAIQQPR